MKLTGLKGRIPVEPLDDERLTNIERRIVAGAAEAAPRGRRAPRFGFSLAVVALVVAIGAGFAGWKLRGERATPTPPPPAIAVAPLHVDTSRERALLDIGDARIESDPSTVFTVTRPDGGVLVTMTRGKVELQVDKRGDRAPLVVAAGDTRVIVVGTRFSVDYGDGSGPVEVRVTEGIVRVERLQQDVRVAAGQAWTTRRGRVALVELPGMQVADADVAIDTQTPDILRPRQATAPEAKPLPKKPPTPVLGGPHVTREEHSAATSASVDLRRLVREQPLLPPMDLGVRPEEAMAKYKDIAYTTRGKEAALALYSIAYQQALKLGRTGDALTTIDAYTRRFSGTEFKDTYQATLWLRVRILCAKTFDDRCRQAAYAHQATGAPGAKVSEMITLAPR